METAPCKICLGRGPSPEFVLDERGDVIPVPFKPCIGCGLEWPVPTPTFSPSVESVLNLMVAKLAPDVAQDFTVVWV